MNPVQRKSIQLLAFVWVLGIATLAPAQSRQWFDLRVYSFKAQKQAESFDKMMAEAALPAIERLGIGPVGVFQPIEPSDDGVARRYVLLAFDSLDEYASLMDRLAEDKVFDQAARTYLYVGKTNPAFMRVESSLYRAFSAMPKLSIPAAEKENAKRLFELRTYESHSEFKARMKVAMFNDGEIDIFNKVGLRSVFFGEAFAAKNMPQLTYMLVHEDQDAKGAAWKRFLDSPAWQRMKGMEEYQDTVSHIEMTMLTAMDYSQIR